MFKQCRIFHILIASILMSGCSREEYPLLRDIESSPPSPPQLNTQSKILLKKDREEALTKSPFPNKAQSSKKEDPNT